MNFSQYTLLLFISTTLVSCAFGTLIDRPNYIDFPYGLKSPSDLFSRYGKTDPEEISTINGEVVTEYCYHSILIKMNINQGGNSRACYRFTSNELAGVTYFSVRTIDATKLAFEQLSKITIGMTKSDVIRILGQPYGVLRYPYVSDRKQIKFLYRDFEDKNRAQVFFDEEGKVTYVYYDSNL